MFIIRGALFIVALACSFVMSGNLDGIDQIRGGIADMVNSFSDNVNIENVNTENLNTETNAPVVGESADGIGKYINPTTLKYFSMLVIVYIGLFRASLFNAIVLGVIGGILFSPEIRQVPVLAEYSVVIDEFVSNIITDIKQRISDVQLPSR